MMEEECTQYSQRILLSVIIAETDNNEDYEELVEEINGLILHIYSRYEKSQK